MKFTIYGLRINNFVFSIGQTHQDLSDRRKDHIKRAKELSSNGHTSPKTMFIMSALQNGFKVEIFKIDEIEAEPVYIKRKDGSQYAVAPKEVGDREEFWQQTYLRKYGGPMVINGKLVLRSKE